jgi:hypothetical protein
LAGTLSSPYVSIRVGGGVEFCPGKRPFDDPIALADGRQLITLEDAGNHVTKLPEAVHEREEWQAAMEALILVVTLGGPTMFAPVYRRFD